MIGRAWHGWSASENADKYHNVFNEAVFPEIAAKNVSVYKEIQLFHGPPITARPSSSQSCGMTPEMLLNSLLRKMWSRHMFSGKPGHCFQGLMSGPSTPKH